MFADYFEIKIGDVTLKGKRLTVREIREAHDALLGSRLDVEKSVDIIRKHVTTADGKPIDPEDMTPGQLREIIAELVLPKEGRSLSDFIGLLS